jgi:hypothetical protein
MAQRPNVLAGANFKPNVGSGVVKQNLLADLASHQSRAPTDEIQYK